MAEETRDLEYIAHQLDSRFQGPFGFKFGWDGILGLIPGIGDVVTSSLSFYIIVRAAMMGAPAALIARMGLNILIDNIFDTIPLLGWIFDFAWKANLKNVRLLQDYSLDPKKIKTKTWIWVALVLFLIFSAIFIFLAVGFYLLWLMISYFQTH